MSDSRSKKLLDALTIDPDLEKLLPPTTPQQNTALKDAIGNEGVIYPLVADERGVLIDGIRTYKICRELKIKNVWVVTLCGLTDEEKRHRRLALNVNRRHLSGKQKRALLEQELLRNPAMSAGRLARLIGCSDTTAQKVKKEMIDKGQIDPCPIEASDGRVFRSQGVLSTLHGVRPVQKVAQEPEQPQTGKILLADKYKRLVRSGKRQKDAVAGSVLPVEQDFRLHCCRFQDLLKLEPDLAGQAALVLTDPPWDQEFIRQYDDLGRVARQTLKPGGLLAVYSGLMYLDLLMKAISQHLTYAWTVTITYPTCVSGTGTHRAGLWLYDQWRPVLVFVNGDNSALASATIKDHLEGERSEKKYHDWQQSLKEVRYFIDTLTVKGDLIVDPCGGSFTTAHAVKEAGGRRFIGCDVSQECANIGKHRLSLVTPPIRLSA